MLQEGLGFATNRQLDHFQQIVAKAYGETSPMSAKLLLEQAKEHLEGTELKILMLMLQMRG